MFSDVYSFKLGKGNSNRRASKRGLRAVCSGRRAGRRADSGRGAAGGLAGGRARGLQANEQANFERFGGYPNASLARN